MTSTKRVSGKVVPIALPLNSANLRVLQSLRDHAAQLVSRLEALDKLNEQLSQLPDEPRYDALVPVASGSKLGYVRGQIVNTKSVIVYLGGGGGGGAIGLEIGRGPALPADDGGTDGKEGAYFVEYTTKQARGVAGRKRTALQNKLERVKAAIQDAEGSLGRDLGYEGSRVNEKNELINEEGLPFIDIQEFEEDEELTKVNDETEAQDPPSTLPSTSGYGTAAAGEITQSAANPRVNLQSAGQSAIPAAKGGANVESSTPRILAAPEEAKPTAAAHRKVSFASDTKDNEAIPDPVDIKSPAVASGSKSTTIAQSAPYKGSPMKTSIIEKEVIRPPPVLTAAERSARKRNEQLHAASDYDGATTVTRGRKVDLSAYLPRSLRGMPIAASSAKGKQRDSSENEDAEMATRDADEYYDDQEDSATQLYSDEDDDEEDYYNYDDDDDEEEEDLHIDDVLAMREAALEYHAKRSSLGAGRGTGPLGGDYQPDEFEDPESSYAKNTGLPFTASTEDGEHRPSRFRTGRLQTARMIIPELKPGDSNLTDQLLPGDNLGPFQDRTQMVEGQSYADDDFKGMSKDEVQTFLRYVKALETGEDLDNLEIVPAPAQGMDSIGPIPAAAPSATTAAVGASEKPPEIKSVSKPAVVAAVVEKGAVPESARAKQTPNETPSDKPKRVSRFRANKGGVP